MKMRDSQLALVVRGVFGTSYVSPFLRRIGFGQLEATKSRFYGRRLGLALEALGEGEGRVDVFAHCDVVGVVAVGEVFAVEEVLDLGLEAPVVGEVVVG